MTQNQISYAKLQEDMRHNQVGETETNRHNVAGENENYRHNVTTEVETNRHNVQTEQTDIGRLNESIRHNKETERQGDANINLGYANLAENSRHNQATETIQSNAQQADSLYKTAMANIAKARQKTENDKYLAQLDQYERSLNLEKNRTSLDGLNRVSQNILKLIDIIYPF